MRFSFDSIKTSLVETLRVFSNFSQNILFFGVYSRLLDVISFGIEKLAFYAEFMYKESTLRTATLRQSVSALAFLLSYKPHRKQGASGRVLVSFDDSFNSKGPVAYIGNSVVFPKFTQFTDDNGDISAYSIQEAIYSEGMIAVNVTIDASSSVINLGKGFIAIPIQNHQIPIGQLISIRGTKNYNGEFILTKLSSPNSIVIESAFIEEVFTGRERVFTGHIYIQVKEGVPKEFLYTTTGIVSEEINLAFDNIDNDILDISIVDAAKNVISGVKIIEEPFLINDTLEYYAQVIDSNDFKEVTIRFGDGLRTRKLQPGEYVLIRYATTKGSLGNILKTGILTKFKSNILDARGNPSSLFVTNDEEISDGNDVEELESIRTHSRNQFQAVIAASDLDWETILTQHPAIAKAKVWTDFDLNRFAITPTQNVVYITAVSNDGNSVTLSQQEEISSSLRSKKDITNVIDWQPLQIVHLYLGIEAIVKPVPFRQIEDQIFNNLLAKYGISNSFFGPISSVYESNFIQVIDEIDAVIYHRTELFHMEKSEEYFDIKAQTGTYKVIVSNETEADPEKQIFLLEGSVQIWIHRKVNGTLTKARQIAQTNSGDPNLLEGINGYSIIGGFVNYTKNTISYNITNILNDIVPFGDEGGSTFEVTEVTTVADDLGSLSGTYWLLSSQHYIWYNVDNGSLDPTISGRTGIEINIAENSTSETVAFATHQSLISEFQAELSGSKITITNSELGSVESAEDGDTNFVIDIKITGKIGNSFGVLNPEGSDPNGYFLRLRYKTRNGNGNFINDIRLPHFYNIIDLDRNDIDFNLSYQD